MELRLVKSSDPILKKSCKRVNEVDNSVKKLMDELTKFCVDHRNPRLLAISAPQVGKDIRVIVVLHRGEIFKLANPEILDTSGKQRFFESCGTVGKGGDIGGFVERPFYVKFEAFDYNNDKVIIEAEEILAIKFLHEIDHLNGIQFIDDCRLVDGKKYEFSGYEEMRDFRKEHPLIVLEEPKERLDKFIVSKK